MSRSIGIHRPFAPILNGFYANGVTFQSPGFAASPCTLGTPCRTRSKPQRGFTNPRCLRHQTIIHYKRGHERPRRTRSITTAFMASSIGIHRPFASASNGFLRQRRYIPQPRVRGFAAYPGYTMPYAIQTPTGFYKPAMPASPTHHPLQTRP